MRLDARFQFPSLRGSGRFLTASVGGGVGYPLFNSLHCGAVVASHQETLVTLASTLGSIPFIAGQWSLPLEWDASLIKAEMFNSLHCGAVVASSSTSSRRWRVSGPVQFPSLRGCGRFRVGTARRGGARRVQFPSLRGSGRFRAWGASSHVSSSQFNSLHCGAVVASIPTPCKGSGNGNVFNSLHCGAVVASASRRFLRRASTSVQFPSLRGSGRFRSADPGGRSVCTSGSIPFIAGQWSLPFRRRPGCGPAPRGFNSLHCGAVVASKAARALS